MMNMVVLDIILDWTMVWLNVAHLHRLLSKVANNYYAVFNFFAVVSAVVNTSYPTCIC